MFLSLYSFEKPWTYLFPTVAQSVRRTSETDGTSVIVVNNVQPDSWSGRPYDFGLYKDGRRVLVLPQVGVSGSATLSLTTTLTFGIVPNTDSLAGGDVIKSLDAIQYKTNVDIIQYSSGLTITLTYDSANGKYTFTPFKTPVFKEQHPHSY